jgi:hypothetical protein
MNVISYFNLISGFKFSSESQELIDIWEKSWQKYGWNTILLNEEDTKKNSLYGKLDLDNPNANFYKTINSSMWRYHRSCYCRLLAYCQYVRENGATLYADYDVINYGFTLDVLESTAENSFFSRDRSSVYLGIEGANQIENAILTFNNNPFQEGDKPGSSNDMRIITKYTNCFKLQKQKDNELYSSSIKADFSNKTPLIHYDGGCYKRGVDRKLSRLDIIKKYDRL